MFNSPLLLKCQVRSTLINFLFMEQLVLQHYEELTLSSPTLHLLSLKRIFSTDFLPESKTEIQYVTYHAQMLGADSLIFCNAPRVDKPYPAKLCWWECDNGGGPNSKKCLHTRHSTNKEIPCFFPMEATSLGKKEDWQVPPILPLDTAKIERHFRRFFYNHRPPRHSILTGSGKGYSSSSVTLAYWARRAAFLCLSSWEISFGFTTILACFSIMLAIAWISSGKKSQSISQSLQMQATKTQLLPPAAPACASAGPQRPRPTTRAKHVALLLPT